MTVRQNCCNFLLLAFHIFGLSYLSDDLSFHEPPLPAIQNNNHVRPTFNEILSQIISLLQSFKRKQHSGNIMIPTQYFMLPGLINNFQCMSKQQSWWFVCFYFSPKTMTPGITFLKQNQVLSSPFTAWWWSSSLSLPLSSSTSFIHYLFHIPSLSFKIKIVLSLTLVCLNSEMSNVNAYTKPIS